MRAVAYHEPQAIEEETALVNLDMPRPHPRGHDLLVEVRAVSVNPVDTKVRRGVTPEPGSAKVLGWDAAGVVVSTGPEATIFRPGDKVFYAGAIDRPGTNAEFHLVDERIVGPMPKTLDFSQAAALPLTTITAWEVLFDRLRVRQPVAGGADAIVIVGGAGGVGSMAIQLVRALTDLTVIATASRSETQAWCRELGAHHVVDHSRPIAVQVEALGLGAPAFVFSTTATGTHVGEIAALIAPQGRFALIDDPHELNISLFKRKSVSIHWEFMFTRSLFATPDMARQHELLAEASAMVDDGRLKTTLSELFGTIDAANLRRAHRLIESGRAKGKIVLAGF